MLEVRDVDVVLEEARVLNQVSLSVSGGEVVGILGPSGSGKSTLLRAVAGLVPIESGSIIWQGNDLEAVPTHQRGFGFMFQGYALFPHLSVAKNVAFGLEMQGLSVSRVDEMLDLVGLPGFGDRDVATLSGGERQRVALARTLAPGPQLVMLDEPLGALDRNLRDDLISEITDLLADTDVTALIVTHDRDEADAVSDRLAIMKEGRIVQTGTLDEIRASPVDSWVDEFVG